MFTFNYINTKFLLIASAWAESLSGRSITGDMPVEGYINKRKGDFNALKRDS